MLKALRRIEGQARGVQRMIEDGRDCAEVIQQMAAIRNAVDRLAHRTVASNLRSCLAGAALDGDRMASVERGLDALAVIRS
ncbi:MAG: transcriptional regulator [Chloroflexota bacterium]|nr:MAG: transcriptional regulator [Chloroflexota bacterium]